MDLEGKTIAELKDAQQFKFEAQKAVFNEYLRINEEIIALNDEILKRLECNY